MRRFYLLIVSVILTTVSLCWPLGGAELTLVKTIGHTDQDDFFFVMIKGAVLSPEKNIYVVDSKAHFLARFDWDGNLIKRIGQKGQGPGDFNGPRSLEFYDDHLYLFDSLNFRVARIDRELKKIKYYRLHDGGLFLGNFAIKDATQCVGNYVSPIHNSEYRAMAIVDLVNQSKKWFFSEVPVPDILERAQKNKNALNPFVLQPRFGIDRKNKELIISFSYPANPISFFIYSMDGQCRNTFSYQFEADYRMPEFLIRGSRRPKTYSVHRVYNIHVHKNHYIALVGKTTFTGPRTYRSEKYLLFFDKQNHALTNKLRVPDFFATFFISPQGYLLATETDQEIPLLYIYKLNP